LLVSARSAFRDDDTLDSDVLAAPQPMDDAESSRSNRLSMIDDPGQISVTDQACQTASADADANQDP
jgi:hypothetical protein